MIVSGFLTSPFDHVRIWSAVASAMDSRAESLTSSTSACFFSLLSATACWRVLVGRRRGPVLGAASRRRSSSSSVPRFGPGQVDAEGLGGAEGVLVELADLDLLARLVDDLDVQAERLHLLDEHLEALGDARLGDVLALDDGLVDLHAAEHVVGLDGEDLLEGVGGAVGLERPHLHLAEALAAELRLPAQRLLRDHRVRAGRPGVDLVVDEVGELQDVDVAHGDRLVVGLAGAAVVERGLAVDAARAAVPPAPSACIVLEELLDRALRARPAPISSQWAPSNTGSTPTPRAR